MSSQGNNNAGQSAFGKFLRQNTASLQGSDTASIIACDTDMNKHTYTHCGDTIFDSLHDNQSAALQLLWVPLCLERPER